MPDAFLFLDSSWRIQFCNTAAARKAGRPAQSLLDRSYWEVWPEHAGTEVERKLRSVMHSNDALRFECKSVPSEPDVWLQMYAYQCDGGLALQFHDAISHRRRSGHDLQATLNCLESIVEGTPDPIFMKDLDSRFVLANSASARVMGLPRQALAGKRHSDFQDELFSEPVEEADRRVMASGNTEVVEEWVVEKGEPRLYLSTKSPWRDKDGRIIGLIGVARDITDRKQSEEALRNSQERLRLALAVGRMGTWDHDLETGRIEWSDGHFRLWGMEPGECQPSLEVFQSRIHPDDWPQLKSRIDNATVSSSDYSAQYRVVWPDGSVHWVEARGKVFFENRVAVRTIGVVSDQTLRKRAEDKLRESARLESLGVLAGGVAHDFNNLLTGMMGSASLIQEQLSMQSRLRPLVEQVLAAGQRATDLTRQMLAYSGKGSFVVHPLDLSREIQRIAPLMKSTIGSNVELHMKLSRSLPKVAGDPADIQQLVMNLVMNAAEAVSPKAGTVTISTGVTEVDGHQAKVFWSSFDISAGEYVFLEVQDTGQGMEAEILSKIFDPFFTTKFTGRGLGLAAVQGIVRALKGALSVKSEKGVGSTFRLYFPIDSSGPQKLESIELKQVRAQKSVLVVDDEAFVHQIAKCALESHGYQVLLATNGEEAVAVLSESERYIDLILLDLTMPVMSGETALREVKRLRPGIPVLASSGYAEEEALEQFGLSVEGFIQKPYTARRLTRHVEEIIRNRNF